MRFLSTIYLIRQRLIRTPLRNFFQICGIAVSAFFLLMALTAHFTIRRPLIHELGRSFPEKRLIVKPMSLPVGPIKLQPLNINKHVVNRLREISGVEKVYPIQPLWFPVYAEGTIMGQYLSTDVVVTGAPLELFFESLPQDTDIGRFDSKKPAPVLISRFFLDVYNMGMAQSNNLPQLNESSAVGKEFDLILGESMMSNTLSASGSQKLKCRVVGFTPDITLMGIVMPLEITQELNRLYVPEKAEQFTMVQVEVADVRMIPEVIPSIKGMGLFVESNQKVMNRFRLALNIISGVVFIFSGGVLLMTILGMTQSESLALVERRREAGLLFALGFRKRNVWFLFAGEKLLVSFAGSLPGCAGFVFLFYYMKNRLAPLVENLPILGSAFEDMNPEPGLLAAGFLIIPIICALISFIIVRGALVSSPASTMKK